MLGQLLLPARQVPPPTTMWRINSPRRGMLLQGDVGCMYGLQWLVRTAVFEQCPFSPDGAEGCCTGLEWLASSCCINAQHVMELPFVCRHILKDGKLSAGVNAKLLQHTHAPPKPTYLTMYLHRTRHCHLAPTTATARPACHACFMAYTLACTFAAPGAAGEAAGSERPPSVPDDG